MLRILLVFLILMSMILARMQRLSAQTTSEQIRVKAKAVLAQLDGKIALPDLQQPVEIVRDRWGVPHIYAHDTDDLFFAQGWTVAQDRLFQIDLWRRVGTGETAEILGPSA